MMVSPTHRPYTGKFRDLFMMFMFLFSLAAVAVMGVAAYGTVSLSGFKHLHGIGIGISILAGIVFIISFLGCCAAFNRSPGLMRFVSGIVLFLFLGQIAFGVFLYMRRDNVDELTIRYWDKSPASARRAIEDAFECKGWNSGSPRDCHAAVQDCVASYKKILLMAASTLGLFEIMGAFGGCFLASRLSRGDDSSKYIYG